MPPRNPQRLLRAGHKVGRGEGLVTDLHEAHARLHEALHQPHKSCRRVTSVDQHTEPDPLQEFSGPGRAQRHPLKRVEAVTQPLKAAGKRWRHHQGKLLQAPQRLLPPGSVGSEEIGY